MSHFLHKNHIENNFKVFQPRDVGIMQGKLPDEIYEQLLKNLKLILEKENKILINPEEENISGEKRSEIESYFFPENFLSYELKSLLYNYYLYYLNAHGILDLLVHRADNVKFDIKISVLNILKPNQYRYFNYPKYPYQFLICLKSPDEIFFANSIKNGRISFFNNIFFKQNTISSDISTNIYLNSYAQTTDFLLKEKDLLFLSLKNHSFIQYPYFNIDGNLNNQYIYLSIYLN